MQIFIGELIGTCLLILLGNGVVSNVVLEKSKGQNSGWIVIATGWGLAVTIALYLVGKISGGHLNPAVTLGFCIAGKTPWPLLPLYMISQLLGAMLGAFLVWCTYRSQFAATDDPLSQRACFCTEPSVRRPFFNFLTEMIATCVLLLGVFGILSEYNAMPSSLAPLAFGLLVLSIGLSLGGPTGYAINPARDLGPRLVYAMLPLSRKGSSDWSYGWVPCLAPLVGAAIAAWFYLCVLSTLKPLDLFSR